MAVRCRAVRRGPLVLCLVSLLFAAASTGCDGPPSAESLKEWTPGDHHSSDDGKLSQTRAQGPQAGGSARDADASGDVSQLVELAWRQQCTPCHGPAGRGDGQMGPMVSAPDLTQAELQRASDTEMASVIKNGRNRMPKFDLPEPVVRGLVARVRALRQR